MKKIKISNEIFHGPIWTYDENNNLIDNLELIISDNLIQKYSSQISEMWDSYVEFDSHDQACWVNERQLINDIPILLDLIQKLKYRLNKINDGTYFVEDNETEYLQKILTEKHI